MLVSCTVTESVTYSAIVEMDASEYEEVKQMPDGEQAEFLLNLIGSDNPEHKCADFVSHFEPVETN